MAQTYQQWNVRLAETATPVYGHSPDDAAERALDMVRRALDGMEGYDVFVYFGDEQREKRYYKRQLSDLVLVR
jgi:hypothetical protein